MEWDRLLDDPGGLRTRLEDKGFDLNARLIDDVTRTQKGGADSYTGANRYWLDVNLKVDLGKLLNCPCGGTLFASFWQTGGENGSKDFGGFNAISSIDAEFRQELAELYLADTFLKDAFDTRIGKMDPTERFNHSEYAGDFMNRAATFPLTFSPSPYFIETAFGADLFYRSKGLYVGAGLFDGSKQEGIETGHGGATHFFSDPGDLFVVSEAGYRWTDGLRPVRAALGYWIHSGDFTGLDGQVLDRSNGWYLLAEGMLHRKNRDDAKDPRGAYLVLRYGEMEASTTPVDWTTTVAVVWKGTFASRRNDSIGLSWSVSSVTSEDPSLIRYGSEQVVEFYYKAQVTPCVSIAPGVQYVANPAGTFGDAVVFGLRAVIDF
jgi:porin